MHYLLNCLGVYLPALELKHVLHVTPVAELNEDVESGLGFDGFFHTYDVL